MAIDRRHFIGATAATGAFSAAEAVAAPRHGHHRAGLGARRRCRPPRRPLQRQRGPDRGAAARDRPPRRRAPAADPRARRLSRAQPRAADRHAPGRRAGRNAHRRERQHAADRRARRRPHPALRHHLRRQRPQPAGQCRADPARGRARRSRSAIARSSARAATASCSRTSRARSPTRSITGALGAAIHALDSRGLVIARNTIRNSAQQRHPGVALAGGRRRHAGDRQPHRGHAARRPAARGRTATPSTCSAPTT